MPWGRYLNGTGKENEIYTEVYREWLQEEMKGGDVGV